MENYERLDEIYSYIKNKQRATTKELSENFNVTEQTIRNDLSSLENELKVVRVHGGAKLFKADTFDERLEENVSEKKTLGMYAATMVEEKDIIFLDGGTSMLYLVDYLPKDIKLKIITASLPIADRCSTLPNVEIYCLGGILNKQTKEMYGPRAIEDAATLLANKAFIGVSGFSLDSEFTENNVYSLEVKRKLLPSVQRKIVIADSKKENRLGIQKAFSFEEIDVFITGKEVSKSFLSQTNGLMEVVTQ
ncbi:DeoR/GlpR family DNA-binding transcription regulator [Enterococcus sp. AZ072]|uniref:DeoR/GlpR family DNA-binding transcription regulator n=1 Tax=unclassified Enterococcus TaxID=2608891 RepID=UPI003D2DF12D